MTKILLLSDSHGNIENMITAVEQSKPDMIFHMGDCWSDSEALKRHYPDIPMKRVIGNCDWWNKGPEELIVEVEGFRILICHGHAYNVKASLLSLEMTTLEKEADIVVFGHTHRVFYDQNNGIAMFNPGSIAEPFPGIPPSYGILTLDQDSETLHMQTFYLE